MTVTSYETLGTAGEEARVLRLQKAAGLVQPQLVTVLRDTGILAKSHTMNWRVKNEKRIHEKIADRRRSGDSNYNADSVTDILGLRLITMYRSDVPELVDLLMNVVWHIRGVNNNPFVKSNIKEFKLFGPGKRTDIRDRLRSAALAAEKFIDAQKIEIMEDQSYTSIHIIAFLKQSVEGEDIKIPLEIQIRTIFEEAWAQIDHSLRYSRTREKAYGDIPSDSYSNPVKRQLEHLKVFLDACADFADSIRDQSIHSELPPAQANPQQILAASVEERTDLDKPDFVIEQLKRSLVGQKALDRMLAAFDEKIQLDGVLEPTEATRNQYLQVATKFLDILGSDIEVENLSDFGKTYVPYFIKMEAAICCLLSGFRRGIERARGVYEELMAEYPQIAAIVYRHGQACSMLDDHLAAIKSFSKCRGLVDQPSTPDGERNSIELPEHHRERFSETLNRLTGFEYWAIAESMSAASNEKLSLLKKAYELSVASVNDPKTIRREIALNNALFHAVRLRECAVGLHLADAVQEYEPKIRAHLEEFIAGREGLATNESDPSFLHTLATTYDHLKDGAAALAAAVRVMDMLAKPLGVQRVGGDRGLMQTPEFNRAMRHDMLESANRIRTKWSGQ